MYDESIMKQCVNLAKFTSTCNIGGPFGAGIVRNGEIVSIRSNSVLEAKDPTAHAEVNAIRDSCLKLNTYDLSDCELYATGYPCPMCLGAIMWAGIKKVYVSGLLEDAEAIQFKDKHIYETIDSLNKTCCNTDILSIEFHDRYLAQNLYEDYSKNDGIIY